MEGSRFYKADVTSASLLPTKADSSVPREGLWQFLVTELSLLVFPSPSLPLSQKLLQGVLIAGTVSTLQGWRWGRESWNFQSSPDLHEAHETLKLPGQRLGPAPRPLLDHHSHVQTPQRLSRSERGPRSCPPRSPLWARHFTGVTLWNPHTCNLRKQVSSTHQTEEDTGSERSSNFSKVTQPTGGRTGTHPHPDAPDCST